MLWGIGLLFLLGILAFFDARPEDGGGTREGMTDTLEGADSFAFDDSDDLSRARSCMNTDDDMMRCGEVNPATGLPMVGCVDVEGNPYGTSDDCTLHGFADSGGDLRFDSSFDD